MFSANLVEKYFWGTINIRRLQFIRREDIFSIS